MKHKNYKIGLFGVTTGFDLVLRLGLKIRVNVRVRAKGSCFSAESLKLYNWKAQGTLHWIKCSCSNSMAEIISGCLISVHISQ